MTRHTDVPRSMEFAAACFVGVIFLAGMLCGGAVVWKVLT